MDVSAEQFDSNDFNPDRCEIDHLFLHIFFVIITLILLITLCGLTQ